MPTKKITALIVLTAGITLAILPFTRERSDSTREVMPPTISIQPTQNPNTETNTAETNKATSDKQQPTAPATEQFLHAKLTIDEKNYDLAFRNGETLYDAMRRLSNKNTITMESHEFSGLGYFIDSINGKRSANGHYWILSINDVKSSFGVSNYNIREHDSIVWTYEKGY